MSAQNTQTGGDKSRRWYSMLKLACLSAGFFLTIASYTVVRELKDSVFMAIIGKEYVPWAKIVSLFILIPAILLYTRLVDVLRRSHLLYFYTIIYGLMGFGFAYFLGHSSIGLPNTDTGPYRLFGWLFYFFIDAFDPFVVCVYWAFANSISSPKEAKNTYGIMIAFSKLGGVASGIMAMLFLSRVIKIPWLVYGDVVNHQFLLVAASFIILSVPLVIQFMMRVVPGYLLHGYEAVYRAEKRRARDVSSDDKPSKSVGLFSGLTTILRYPYVTGIFAFTVFYDIVGTVISYQRLSITQSISSSTSEVTGFLFQQAVGSQMISVVVALLGTHTLLRLFGERFCLLLVPILTGVMLFAFVFNGMFGFVSQTTVVLIVYMGLRSMKYAFSTPLRETLYIPTVKEVKFKAKSWIDTFGSKFAKAGGSAFNMATIGVGRTMLAVINTGFFGLIVSLWIGVAYYLGKRFEQTIARNEVIGGDGD